MSYYCCSGSYATKKNLVWVMIAIGFGCESSAAVAVQACYCYLCVTVVVVVVVDVADVVSYKKSEQTVGAEFVVNLNY